MTNKTITGAYAAGFTLGSQYANLYVTQSASVGGTGVLVQGASEVSNFGTISATSANANGVYLAAGTSGVFNQFGASIHAYVGVKSAASSGAGVAIRNYGVIYGHLYGVDLLAGGTISNGSAATISGYRTAVQVSGGSGVVNNNGTLGGGSVGVYLSGGAVTNGYAADTGATIEAYRGIVAGGGSGVVTVNNFGTISYNSYGLFTGGLYLAGAGGDVTNGSLEDTKALIAAHEAVVLSTGTVSNYGTILGNGPSGYGVRLASGGTLTNGAPLDRVALIEGTGNGYAVDANESTVTNFGTILADGSAGAEMNGGRLVNGGDGDTTALVQGYVGVKLVGAAGGVINFATLAGADVAGGFGAALDAGTITNGSASVRTALVEGYGGVDLGGGAKLSNFGTVLGQGVGDSAAVYGSDGGGVYNGSVTDIGALIEGYSGIKIAGAAGEVVNFGTVAAEGAAGCPAVGFVDGGEVENGGGADKTATLIGVTGVDLGAVGTVINAGTINGLSGYGASLAAGGVITNGGGTNHAALIEGYGGIGANGPATIRNSGTILADGGGYGARLLDGGDLTNGSINNACALVEGYGGVFLYAAGSVTNFGTILAQGDTSGTGVYLQAKDTLANGSADHQGAVIEGVVGVSTAYLKLGNTVINFGTIIGEGGAAVHFDSFNDDLVVEAGSAFVGAVYGAGGTLDLASGTGTLTGLISNGDVKVSGSMATTTFTDFGTVEVAGGASFTAAGGGAIGATEGLIDAGTLTTTGTLAVAGTLTTSGTLAGTGTLAIAGGTSTFGAGTSLTIAKVTVAGAATKVNVGTNLTYAGVWTQSAGTLSVATGDKITFTGAGNSFTGTLAGVGEIIFSGGSDTLSGAITLSAKLSVTTPNLIVAAGGATLGGTGELILSNTAANSLHGASAAATLTNNGKIVGAGAIGGGVMTLVIGATGSIDGDEALALTLDTGSNTIANAGIIYALGAGGTIVKSAVNNTGKLYADGGTLTMEGAVTGAGVGDINGGTLDAAGAFTENVGFLGTAGTLELANAQAYTGTIIGFSKTGTNSLDLNDIAFGAKTKATYSGTTTSGTLTVSDGTHTAKLALSGDYTTSAFSVSSDGHGGTTVVDPPGASQAHAFIAAMAGFGAEGVAAGTSAEPWPPAPAVLAAPAGGAR